MDKIEINILKSLLNGNHLSKIEELKAYDVVLELRRALHLRGINK
jgi:hypothetical protein